MFALLVFTATESVNKANATMPIDVVNGNRLSFSASWLRFTVFQQEERGRMNTRVGAASVYHAETP